MGYSSDVAYIVQFKSLEDRDAYITLLLAKNDKTTTEAVEETNYERTDRAVITFKAGDVKWYSNFADVMAHTALYQDAHELYDADYRFVAVGEDGQESFDAQENNSDLYDDLHAVHTVNTSF